MALKNKLQRVGAAISRKVTGMDKFPQSVNLTIKGEEGFRTFYGGSVSILINLVMLVYAVNLFITMINRGDSNRSKSAEIIDLAQNDEDIYLKDYGFSIGISVTDFQGKPVDLDPTYFTILAEEAIIPRGDYSTTKFRNLGIRLWERDDFDVPEEDKDKLIASQAYCPGVKDYKVAGNLASDKFTNIRFIVNKCQGGGWASDADIEAKMNQVIIGVIYTNYYLDFEDYETPIKKYFDDRYAYKLMSGFSKTNNLYIKQNSGKINKTHRYILFLIWLMKVNNFDFIAELSDSFLQLTSPEETKFLSSERAETDIALDSTNYMQVTFKVDPEKGTYERTVFSLLDLFGLLGGVLEVSYFRIIIS